MPNTENNTYSTIDNRIVENEASISASSQQASAISAVSSSAVLTSSPSVPVIELSPEDAQALAISLTAQSTISSTSAEGHAVAVPSAKRERIIFSSSSSSGSSLFSNSNGTNPLDEETKSKRARTRNTPSDILSGNLLDSTSSASESLLITSSLESPSNISENQTCSSKGPTFISAHEDEEVVSIKLKTLINTAKLLLNLEREHTNHYNSKFSTQVFEQILEVLAPITANEPLACQLKIHAMLKLCCIFAINPNQKDISLFASYLDQTNTLLPFIDNHSEHRAMEIAFLVYKGYLLIRQQKKQEAYAILMQARARTNENPTTSIQLRAQTSLYLAELLFDFGNITGAAQEADAAIFFFNKMSLGAYHPWIKRSECIRIAAGYIESVCFGKTCTAGENETKVIIMNVC